MSKPASVVLGAAGVIALAGILGLCVLRDRQPSPLPSKAPVAAATAVTPAASAERLMPNLPAPIAGPRLRRETGPDAGKRMMDEASLMAKLHDLAASDPGLSLRLAREAVARFADSPNAPEFAWNVAKALANMGRYEEAEEEAREMVKKYPGNDFANDVERHLLRHPPNPSDLPPAP